MKDARPAPDAESSDRGPTLLKAARRAIEAELGLPVAAPPDGPWLRAPGAVFVTLRGPDGRLRGCIGSLEARRSLIDDVEANARGAAFRDPRFAPVSATEIAELIVEVSELSTPESLPVADEESALAALEPGIDGVILAFGGRRATFLPQVWAQLPTPRDFLARLKEKAGLPAVFWDREIALSRYTVRSYSEK